MKTIVISAVNLVEAGTLEILKDCLRFLSEYSVKNNYKVIAIVHKKELAEFPNIEYIETQWPKKRWTNRLWYEYVSMDKISKELGDVYLWFSLHDTSPNVQAERRAVYCHNSFSFYKWKLHDLVFAPKIALFAIFTKFIYQTNIRKNNFLVVQQEWFREGLSKMFGINPRKIIVSRPKISDAVPENKSISKSDTLYHFLFAGSPNSHKNFEVICQAAKILVEEYKINNFKVSITVKGTENKYAQWLKRNWGNIDNIDFMGFIPKTKLIELYSTTDCLIYSSKVESWGLPISEFSKYERPMLLADLPYAHETAEGSLKTAYFNPDKPAELAKLMADLIKGDETFLSKQAVKELAEPKAENWEELFNMLLK
jgi:glycosyltransferase involved in cell wall biosynthesis